MVLSILIVTILISLHHGVLIAPDTGSYTGYHVIRGPGYPLWLTFFKTMGGQGWQTVAVTVQVLMGLGAVWHTLRWLQKEFTLHFAALGLIALFLVSPIVWGYSNYLLSEALAYPLFLLCTTSLWRALKGDQLTPVIFGSCLLLLLLTRQQYMFFVVVGLVVASLTAIHLTSKRLVIGWVAASLLPPLVGTTLERSYHYIYTGHFVSTPFVGLQFSVLPLTAVPNLETATFADKGVESFVRQVGAKIRTDGLGEWCPTNGNFYPMNYHIFYNYLHWGTIANLYGKINAVKNKELTSMENALECNAFLLKTAFAAIVQNPLGYARNYISLWRSAFANYYLLILSLAGLGILCVACCYTQGQLFVLAYVSLLMHVGNTSLVSFFEPPISRYIHSTEITYFIALILALSSLASKKAQRGHA